MKITIALAATVLALMQSRTPAFSQAANGVGNCMPQVYISYYKTPPGRQDDWLALYMKWHHPIMEYEIAHGATTSSKLYAAGDHSPGAPWDFAIITTYPPPGEAKPLEISRPELIRKLYPNLKDYVAGEKARWALTIDHWDEKLNEMNWMEPMSLYEPVEGGCKPGKK